MDRKQFRSQLNFRVLAKLFFDIAEERYPSGEKIKQLASRLVAPLTKDALENTYLQIAVLSVMRDMVRKVSPHIYRSIQHRDDLFTAIIEALEDLEDTVEELEEASEEEEAET
jgi:type III secretion protein W